MFYSRDTRQYSTALLSSGGSIIGRSLVIAYTVPLVYIIPYVLQYENLSCHLSLSTVHIDRALSLSLSLQYTAGKGRNREESTRNTSTPTPYTIHPLFRGKVPPTGLYTTPYNSSMLMFDKKNQLSFSIKIN